MSVAADTCPYPKPFPEGFADCPAFQPTAFLPRTSREAPLEEGWTCVHLVVGEAGHGEFYPRCRLGTTGDRQRWALAHAERAEVLRELRYSLYAVVAPLLPDLLAAQRLVREDRGAAFDSLAAEFIGAMDTWFDAHEEGLRRLGIPVAAGMGIMRDTIAHWRAHNDPINTAEPPPEVVERYPEVRPLLLPDSD